MKNKEIGDKITREKEWKKQEVHKVRCYQEVVAAIDRVQCFRRSIIDVLTLTLQWGIIFIWYLCNDCMVIWVSLKTLMNRSINVRKDGKNFLHIEKTVLQSRRFLLSAL